MPLEPPWRALGGPRLSPWPAGVVMAAAAPECGRGRIINWLRQLLVDPHAHL